jgi:hypothetical protein
MQYGNMVHMIKKKHRELRTVRLYLIISSTHFYTIIYKYEGNIIKKNIFMN